VEHRDDRDPTRPVHRGDEVEDLDRVPDVEVGGRLVEQQDARLLRESARDDDALGSPPESSVMRRAASSRMPVSAMTRSAIATSRALWRTAVQNRTFDVGRYVNPPAQKRR
jgi:hypothetical protein